MIRKFAGLVVLLIVMAGLAACAGIVPAKKADVPLAQAAVSRLNAMGSSPAAPMMIRIFKQSSELEVWKQTKSGEFKLFKTYEICSWSGEFGPKIKEGDRQSPEGFYTITPGLLNPNSNYYLAFNTGFPNKFDRSYGRTGSDLMVHGDCSSRGCYAMTDEGIAEIYALARETFRGGNQSFQLQIFPFRMTPQNLAKNAKSPHLAFWQNIKDGYDRFELTRRPATWDVCSRKYVFDVSGSGLDASGVCPAGIGTPSAQLAAKQNADKVAFEAAVASLGAKEQKAVADAAAAAEQQQALKDRGEAINGAVSSFFGGIGGLFGNGGAGGNGGTGADGGDTETPVVDPGVVAPVPQPPINRG